MLSFFLFIYIQSLPVIHAECRYALTGTNSRPIKLDLCSDLKWGHIIHSYSRHCRGDDSYVTNRLYYEEGCPSDPSKSYNQSTSTPCFIDESINNCPSIPMHAYYMTPDKSISYEYHDAWDYNETWEPGNPCYYDVSGEYFGYHAIYDACLSNPTSNKYPYIKGEYYNGGFETNCSYKVNYYSDSKCKHKINSSYTYGEECRLGTNSIPYSFYFPDCPWRPNTVWVIVFVVLGCCCCGCICYFFIKFLNEKGISCECCCLLCHLCEYCQRKRYERTRRRNAHKEQIRLQRIRELEMEMQQKQKGEEEYDEIAMQKQRNRMEREKQELKEKQTTNYIDRTSGNTKIENDIQNDNDEMINKQGTLSYSAAQCVICLDILLENEASRLVCGHKFHTHCIEEYNESKSECPLCRKKIAFNQES